MSEPEELQEIFLSAQVIKDLKAKRSAATEEIKELEARLKTAREQALEYESKLRAAAFFVPALAKELEEEADEAELPSLTEAILKTLRRYPPGSARPLASIRARLSVEGYPEAKLRANPNYFYTALKRLKDRNLIRYDGNTIRLLPPQAGAPKA